MVLETRHAGATSDDVPPLVSQLDENYNAIVPRGYVLRHLGTLGGQTEPENSRTPHPGRYQPLEGLEILRARVCSSQGRSGPSIIQRRAHIPILSGPRAAGMVATVERPTSPPPPPDVLRPLRPANSSVGGGALSSLPPSPVKTA